MGDTLTLTEPCRPGTWQHVSISWGPEAELFTLSSAHFDQNAHEAYDHIDAEEET